MRKFATIVVATLVLAGCDDPKPGLVTPQRSAGVDACAQRLASLADGDVLKELCHCATARFVTQSLTLADLDGARAPRAWEQVRWCAKQAGIGQEPAKATPSPSPSSGRD